MSAEYCAHPFLKEKSRLCDYEITTDHLASMLSVTRHHIRHIPREDLLQLTEMVYHANGSIRGACAIGEVELRGLNISCAHYHIEMDRFVLPDGCTGASHLHVLRTEVKAVIRTMCQIRREGEPAKVVLFGFMDLLSDTFFVMCLYENAQGDVREREFISRPYV